MSTPSQYLDIHQAATPDPVPGPKQDENPAELSEIRTIKKIYETYKAERKEYDADWSTYFDFYKGKQWPQRGINQPPSFNLVRTVIQTTVPILTDTYPGVNIGPKKPTDYDFSQTIDKVVRDAWTRNSLDLTMVEWSTDSMIYGTSILKVGWDQDKLGGLGDIDVEIKDINDIFVSKQAVDFNKNCTCVIERGIKSVGWLKRKFPDKADRIMADSSTKSDKDKDGQIDKFQIVSPTDQNYHINTGNNALYGSSGEEETAEYLECWIDSEEVEDYYDEYDQDGKGVGEVAGEKRKFPNGKLVTILLNQNILLFSGDNPYSDGFKPFVRLVDAQLPRRFYGEGEIEPLMEMQKYLNTIFANILKQVNLMSNPTWIKDSNCGITDEQISNIIGQILTKNPDTTIARIQGENIPESMLKLMQMLPSFVDTISGVHDITQGRKPTGITAAAAMETMQEAAQTRIRLKERNLQSALIQLGTLIVSRIMQFVREPRVIKIDDGGQWPTYFEFHIEDVTDPETGMDKYRMVKTEQNYDENQQVYTPSQTIASEPTEGLFDIQVQTGTSMPYNKNQKAILSLKLFEAGLIDDEACLKDMDYPNYEQVLQRMNVKRQQAAAAQAQEAQMQALQKQHQGQTIRSFAPPSTPNQG